MNILVSSGNRKFHIFLPTGLLFNRGTLWLVKKTAYGNANLARWGNVQMPPPEAMDALFAEMRRIKKKHGRWELVDVQSSDGDIVRIIL